MTQEQNFIFDWNYLCDKIQPLWVEYDAEGFASLWMLQNTFRDITLPHTLPKSILIDIEYVKQNPVICFLRDKNIVSEIDKFKSRLGNGICKKISVEENQPNFSGLNHGPSAIVICLNPDGTHENCYLSDEDKSVLEMTTNLSGNYNCVYLVQGKTHHKQYNAEDLKCLSTTISRFYGEKVKSKSIFRKMFFVEEDQALYRIGLCLLENLTPYLMRICDECRLKRKTFFLLDAKSRSEEESSQNSKIQCILDRVRKEVDIILESILFHEFKTVALRHVKVKGFGCKDNSLNVIIKTDVNSSEKTEIQEYLANYFDYKDGIINGKYELRIMFKERKMQYFSNFQQGSKVKTNCESTYENKNFGSVGMFLQDTNGSYYFTTCAHVIGKDALAFRADDGTELGENIFAVNSGQDASNRLLDFSVVKIRPERDLMCTFGLKFITGEFTKFRVFRGDVVEVRKRKLFIWGARDSVMRLGTCFSCDDDDGYLSFCVDTENFAGPGDSGSLICIGDQVNSCFAAFILVGGRHDSDPEEYVAFKVSDAIDMIQSESLAIEPFSHPILNVQITGRSASE